MLQREEWLHLARKINWNFSYVNEKEVFPEIVSGSPWLPHTEWQDWHEPYQTSFTEYVKNQKEKDESVYAVRNAIGTKKAFQKLADVWISGLKIHAATLPLAEFAAVIGELRGARFGRDSAWRNMATFGALDELRHTQIPLLLMHPLVEWDIQFDWTHKFYHSNNWIAIASRHLFDELLLGSNAIEFPIATNFVFETGFTNLQFIGLAVLADQVDDHLFETMVKSIQTDEARHAQIGNSVLDILVKYDKKYAQFLLDKWFWRSWILFAVVTGFHIDYFTPLDKRTTSFKEFMQEWVVVQFVNTLDKYGLDKPWYWDIFLDSLDSYHHMAYASAYTYRATTWFNFVVPSPQERAWLREQYPKYWDDFDAVWDTITTRWEETDIGNEFGVHATAMPSFCNLCQMVLCHGTPKQNTANTLVYQDRNYIFCSEPCRWIFEQEPERYAAHKDVIKRVLDGEAPGNLIALLQEYFHLNHETWGKDIYGGDYAWMNRKPKPGAPS